MPKKRRYQDQNLGRSESRVAPPRLKGADRAASPGSPNPSGVCAYLSSIVFGKQVLASEMSSIPTSPPESLLTLQRGCLGRADYGIRDQAGNGHAQGRTQRKPWPVPSSGSGLHCLVEPRVSLLALSLHSPHPCVPLTHPPVCNPRTLSSPSSLPSGPWAKPPPASLCQPVNVPLCGSPDARAFLGRCYFNI